MSAHSLPDVRGVTIDAAHTRDIDDAIWVTEDGAEFRIFVSISDVSRSIHPKTELDDRARAAVATKYFATGNSPMLPRRLSESSLSLLPKVPRKTMTVEVSLSPSFDAKLTGIYLSQLTSEARIAYSEIPKILETKDHEHHGLLSRAAKVSMGLLERRRAAGALALYDLNNGWVTTEEGYVRKLESKEETIGNIIVQELMILANAVVAEFAVQNDIPVPFRNHVARAAAPDRAELMAQIQSAFKTPLANLDLIRQQTHMLLEKASYGASLFGHYGLNLPAYLHFTSPIRRYPDLVVHRQIRAFLKKDPLPYTREDIESLAQHVNHVLQAERDAVKEHMKEKANNKAQAMLDARRLEGLNSKDFERVIKVWTRSPNEVPGEIRQAFLHRLRDNRVPLVCFASVLVDANPAMGWRDLQEATLARMVSKPEEAVSVLSMAVQMNSWPAPTFEATRQGPDHAPSFTATAFLAHPNGPLKGGPSQGTTSKEARQRAVLGLLAELARLPVPEFQIESAPPPAPSAKAAEIDWSKDPISALQEYSQALGKPSPEFNFAITGPSHVPMITCECKFDGHTRSASAGKKQDAKRLAAHAVLSLVGKR